MDKEYAQAIAKEVRQGNVDEATLVTKLVAHLKASGRVKLLPGILRELKRIEAREEALAPVVEAATEAETTSALASARALGIEAAHATVNPSLIRGWRARSGSTLIDRSAKASLISMYQKITN